MNLQMSTNRYGSNNQWVELHKKQAGDQDREKSPGKLERATLLKEIQLVVQLGRSHSQERLGWKA